ncbi:squamous cell carcinoma antigen recognized by T-cells 3 [Galendromus occidentalis]|uniref:Squamous cell carcinoma antigen recognized by T-cells 3 n=1 Tax=Galendromus occidentalis TaxID=34638 RepID=A0AAJ7L2Z9_9ACAR|nr:squamous cell carcinoma antigen recognized by T-cells 3 [Galendromus occidentalis]
MQDDNPEEMETNQAEAIDDSGDSDLESDGEDTDAQRETSNARLKAFEQSIAENPYNYSVHEDFIKFLEKGDDLDKLRAAREAMAKLFPLTPQLWLTWIRQEIDLCLDEEEKLKVLELFQRAVKDYTSVDVWLEYCQFGIGLSGEGNFERARAIFEEACNKVGLHVQKGSLIFEAYREFELAIYATMPDGAAPDDKLAKDKEKQRRKIVSLFKRQLSVPLFDMEKTLAELKEFAAHEADSNIILIYQKALKKLESIHPFEMKLNNLSSPATFGDYEEYLELEIREGDAARIQMLFERAVTDDCLRVELWEKYNKYMDLTLKIDSLALPVHERSIRNVPWSSSLWVSYLTCLERMSAPTEKIEAILKDARQVAILSATDALNLWIFHLSNLRRKIDFKEPSSELVEQLRELFEKAEVELTEFTDADTEQHLESLFYYWATVEANLGNTQRWREIWQKITRQGASSQVKTWLSYANFEKTYGDFKHYRKVLQRGLYASADWPEQIGEQWVQAELQEGTLDGLQEAQSKFEARMRVVNEKRDKAATRELLNAQSTQPPELSSKRELKPKKRKASESPVKNDSEDKKGKWKNLSDGDGFKMPLPVGPKSSEGSGTSHKPAPSDDDPLREAQTVFLSNLAYEVEEEKIREVFKDVGRIEELRLVRDYKHRCKGFGYLVFDDLNSVQSALKKDRAPIDGRPVFVSRCNERKQFEFSLGLEKNKLFVKNVPLDATKEELQELFARCGALSDVRLCVLRNGKFKGMAYIDFVDEPSASAAVVKFDGFDMRGKTLSVAISNPPPRKEKSLTQAPERKSKEPTMKTRLFVPRSLLTKAATDKSHSVTAETKNLGAAATNDDFRNLFLNK